MYNTKQKQLVEKIKIINKKLKLNKIDYSLFVYNLNDLKNLEADKFFYKIIKNKNGIKLKIKIYDYVPEEQQNKYIDLKYYIRYDINDMTILK